MPDPRPKKLIPIEQYTPGQDVIAPAVTPDGKPKKLIPLEDYTPGKYTQEPVMYTGEEHVPEPTFIDKAAKAWSSSWGQLGESVGGGIEWIGHENDLKALSEFGTKLKDAGIRMEQENYQEVSKDIQDFNWGDLMKADFWSQKATTIIPSAISLVAPSLLAGIGGSAATASALSPFAPAALAEPTPIGEILYTAAVAAGGVIASATVSRTLEGVMEAGNTWNGLVRDLQEKGYSIEDAKRLAGGGAAEVFKNNYKLTGLDATQFALAFAKLPNLGKLGKFAEAIPKSAKITGRLAAGVSTEAGEELYQNWISAQAINRVKGVPLETWDEFIAKPENKEAAVLGGIGGLLFGGAGELTKSENWVKTVEDQKKKIVKGVDNINEFTDQLNKAATLEEQQIIQGQFRKKLISNQVVNGQGTYAVKKIKEYQDKGLLTQDEADSYTDTINQFQEYNKSLSDVPATAEQKEELLDLAWQESTINKEIERLKATPANAIVQGKIKVLEADKSGIVDKIKNIIAGKPQEKVEAEEMQQPTPVAGEQATPTTEVPVTPIKETSGEGVVPIAAEEMPPSVASPEAKETFDQFIEKEIAGKDFKSRATLDSERHKAFGNFLRNVPGKTLKGGSVNIRSYGVTSKYGASFRAAFGDKHFNFSSKEFTNQDLPKEITDVKIDAKLVEPTDANLSPEQKKAVVTKPDGTKVFKFKDVSTEYPSIIELRADENLADEAGKIVVAKGEVVGKIRYSDFGRKEGVGVKYEKEGKPSVVRDKNIIQVGRNTYKVERQQIQTVGGEAVPGDIKITDASGGEVTGRRRKQIIRKYADKFDYRAGETALKGKEETAPQFATPEEAHRYVAEKSQNPLEIMEEYVAAKVSRPPSRESYKDQLINEQISAKRGINRDSFIQASDENYVTDAMTHDKKGLLTDNGDTVDEILSTLEYEHPDMNFTPEDIVEYIRTYETNTGYEKATKKTAQAEPAHVTALRNRFREITGFDMTEGNINKQIEEEIKKLDKKILTEEFLNRPEDAENYAALSDEYERQYESEVQEILSKEHEAISALRGGEEGPEQGEEKEYIDPYQQRSTEKGTETSKERQAKIDQLKKALPGIEVTEDATLPDGVAGEFDGTTVRLNPNYNLSDTAIHEFGHALIDITGGAENSFNRKGIEQLRSTDLWNEVAEKYPDLKGEMLEKEVLATAIGREGAIVWAEKEAKSKFKNWLDAFFMKVKRLLGIEKNVAKNLANQLLAGQKISEQKLSKKETQQQRADKEKKTIRDSRPKSFRRWAEENGIDVEEYEIRLEEIEEELAEATDAERDELEGEKEFKENALEDAKADYQQYLKDREEILERVESNGDVSKMDLTKLIETVGIMNKFKDFKNTAAYKDIMFNIGQRINTMQAQLLKGADVNFDITKANVGDLTKSDVFMQGLSTISEEFPAIQGLYRQYRDSYTKHVDELIKSKEITDKLATSVINEYNKKNGIYGKAKNFTTGGGHKYFSYMAKDGKLITPDMAEYKALSQTQKNLLEAVRGNVEKYKQYAGIDGDVLLQSNRGFIESLQKGSGLFRAYANWLTRNYNVREVKVKFTDPRTGNTQHAYYGDVENTLNDYAKEGVLEKVRAMALLAKYRTQAQGWLEKSRHSDDTPFELRGGNGRYYMSPEGNLVGKFAGQHKGDFSENYYASYMQFMQDAVFSKHMAPIVPMFEGVEAFYKAMGNNKENVLKFLEIAKKGKLFGETKESGGGATIDQILKGIRKWTSLRFMAFNIQANIWNVFVGKYSAFRNDFSSAARGERRFFASAIKGKKKNKALNIIKKHLPTLLGDINDINPEKYAGRYFDMLAYGGLKVGEEYIRGAAIIGRLSNQHYNWLDSNGNVKGKDAEEIADRTKIIREELLKASSKTDKVQGRYSEIEKRNFGYMTLGQSFGQFKVWMPEFFSERFARKYRDADGTLHEGSFSTLWRYGAKNLLRDITKREFYTSDETKYANMRKNFKGFLATAAMLSLYLSASDDKEDKEMSQRLRKALGGINGVFDPIAGKFLLEQPVASMSVVVDLYDTVTAAWTLAEYKGKGAYGDKGDLKAPGMAFNLLPGHSAIKQIGDLADDE